MRHVRPAPKPPVFPTIAPGGLDLRPFDGARAKILRRRLLWVDPPAVIWAGKSHHLSTWDPVDFHHADLQSA